MRELYLLRHGERNASGDLTNNARQAAGDLGKRLPTFRLVISSDAKRAIQTATLVTNTEPKIDPRAGFYAPAEKQSRQIYEYGVSTGINFFEAAQTYKNGELAEGIHKYAIELNQLIDQTLERLGEGEAALIVSHDLTITTAMALRGMPMVSSTYLNGYKVTSVGKVIPFKPKA